MVGLPFLDPAYVGALVHWTVIFFTITKLSLSNISSLYINTSKIKGYAIIYRLLEGVGMFLRFNALHHAFNNSVKELLDAIFLWHVQRRYAISLCYQKQLEIRVVETQR